MKQISATIITFNEEKNIERCLKSLHGIADEIIVVDSNSTDKTVEICEQYNARVFQNPFEGYSQQKNFAVSKSSYDIILSLDADEALSDKLRSSILEVKENWKNNAYNFNRLTNFCGSWIKNGGWYPDKQLRLWDKNWGSWNKNKIHEKVEIKSNAKLGFLKGDLLHYSYYTISEYISQLNKYSDLKAEELIRRNKKPNFLMLLFKPLIKFIINYFLKKGLLDGYYGFVLAVSSAYATFMTYVKLKHKLKSV